MQSHRPSSPEPGQVTEFRRGSDGRERQRSASPPTSLPPRTGRPPSPVSSLPPRPGRQPSTPRGRPPAPPPRPRIPPPPRRTDRERWDSPSGRIDRPVMYDQYSRDSRDSREERISRRGSSPGSRGSVSRDGTPARDSREIPKEPVFKGLDGLTQYLSRSIMAKAKVEQASRALQRIKEFQPDAVTLAEAEGALSAAESALKTECESLQDSFVSLLQQVLAVPGVSTGDVSGLHVDELKSRVSRLEQRSQQPAPGLTEEEIKAFVKASTPTTTSPVTPTMSEEEIRTLVRKEGVTEDRVREIARACNTGLNEAQVRAIVAKAAPSEESVREIVKASATGLNEEQVRVIVKKSVPVGISDEHIKALIRLNAPTLDQVKDIVKASIPTTLSAPAAPPATAIPVQASPAPQIAPAQASTSLPVQLNAPKVEEAQGESAAGARPQIKLRALLSEVLQRVEAVESALDERYEGLQSDIDEQRFDLNQAVGKYELAAARRAALPPAASAGASLEGTPAPGAVTPTQPPATTSAPVNSVPANSAPNSEIAMLKAQMDAMRAQLSTVTSEVSVLRAEVATLNAWPANAQAPANAKQPAALGPEFDAKMAGWKTAILKDIEDWVHSKLPGIIAPILEDMKGKVLAQMLVEARAGGMGAAQSVPRVNSPSGRFAPQAQAFAQQPQTQYQQQQQYGYQPYQHR